MNDSLGGPGSGYQSSGSPAGNLEPDIGYEGDFESAYENSGPEFLSRQVSPNAIESHYRTLEECYAQDLDSAAIFLLSSFFDTGIRGMKDLILEEAQEEPGNDFLSVEDINGRFRNNLNTVKLLGGIDIDEYQVINKTRESRNFLAHKGPEQYRSENLTPLEEGNTLEDAIDLYESWLNIPPEKSITADSRETFSQKDFNNSRCVAIDEAIEIRAEEPAVIMISDFFEEYLKDQLTELGNGSYELHGSPRNIERMRFDQKLGVSVNLTESENFHFDITPESMPLERMIEVFRNTREARNNYIHDLAYFDPEEPAGLKMEFNELEEIYRQIRGEIGRSSGENYFGELGIEELDQSLKSVNSDILEP